MELFKAFKEWSDQNDGQIEIFTSAGRMTAINRLKPGATQEKIEDISNFFSVSLPPDYIGFLQICNGASLFEHPEYGGEVLLYSAQDVMHYNEPTDRKIAVANIVDDRILIDLDRWHSGEEEYLLLCESMNPVDFSGHFNTNFKTWLERFIISQGEKFWYWKTDRYIF